MTSHDDPICIVCSECTNPIKKTYEQLKASAKYPACDR